jgi:hypothetical protein
MAGQLSGWRHLFSVWKMQCAMAIAGENSGMAKAKIWRVSAAWPNIENETGGGEEAAYLGGLKMASCQRKYRKWRNINGKAAKRKAASVISENESFISVFS